MKDEYSEVVRQFYEIYRQLQKKHNLRLRIHFDIYDDGRIEIREYEGETCGKYVCKVKEKEDIECYRKAIQELEHYRREKEKGGDGKSAAMAV